MQVTDLKKHHIHTGSRHSQHIISSGQRSRCFLESTLWMWIDIRWTIKWYHQPKFFTKNIRTYPGYFMSLVREISRASTVLPHIVMHNARVEKCAWCFVPIKNLRLIIQRGCGIALFCVHWDQVFFHEKLTQKKTKKRTEKRGWRRSRKTGLGQAAPRCLCQALLVSLWFLLLFAHAQTCA